MANEAILITETALPVNMLCADGAGIEKMTLLSLADPRTVAAHASVGQKFGGVAYGEKIANNGITSIAVYNQSGLRFDMVASGAITVGEPVMLSGTANMVAAATTNSGGVSFGVAEETVATGERINVRLI